MKRIILGSLITGILVGCGPVEQISDSCWQSGDMRGACEFVFGKKNHDQDDVIDNQGKRVSDAERRLAQLESNYSNMSATLQGIQLNVSTLFTDLNSATVEINSLRADQTSFATALDQLQVSMTDLSVTVTGINNSLVETQADVSGLVSSLGALSNSQIALHNYVDSLVSQGTAAYNDIQGEIAALQAMNATVVNNTTIVNNNLTALQNQMNTTTIQVAQLAGYDSIVMMIDPCGKQGTFDEVFLRTVNGETVAYFENGGDRHLVSLNPNQSYVTTDGTNCYFYTDSHGKVCSVIGGVLICQ